MSDTDDASALRGDPRPQPVPGAAPANPGRAPRIPAWQRETQIETRLGVAAAILVAAALQYALPDRFTLIRPGWLLPVLEVALLAVLTAMNPVRVTRYTRQTRRVALLLVALVSVDNGASAGLLDTKLVTGGAGSDAGPLLASAAAIYLTNLIAFGIWYWELDRGGPQDRAAGRSRYPDFLFPQMTQPHLARDDWEPAFPDYLYVSLTNATAFSPTDTMPLTRWAKTLMALQSVVALSTTGLVLARAVNILK